MVVYLLFSRYFVSVFLVSMHVLIGGAGRAVFSEACISKNN